MVPAAEKMSEYGLRLREKQKLRRFYCLNETQFSTVYDKATNMAGQTGHNFLQLLERRLDSVVYRLGFGVSLSGAPARLPRTFYCQRTQA